MESERSIAPGVMECANGGGRIGKLETPRVYREQVVCADCWTKLQTEEAALQGVESVRSEAMAYESRADTAARLRAIPVAVEKRPSASIILILGRIIFGALTLLGLFVALSGKFGATEDERAIYTGINIMWPSALIFLVTFVKRAF